MANTAALDPGRPPRPPSPFWVQMTIPPSREPLHQTASGTTPPSATPQGVLAAVRASPSEPPVEARVFGSLMMLEVIGRLGDVVDDVHAAILQALAEEPRAVICDLARLVVGTEQEPFGFIGAVGKQVQAWPGTPVALLCPDAGVRARLRRQRLREHVMIRATLKGALSSLDRMDAPSVAHQPLAAHVTSARAGRDFVSRTCLDWGLRHMVAPACLVVSELVTNAMLHTHGEMTASIARHGTCLRLAVRDHGTGMPKLREAGPDGVNGRGMALVAGFSRTWGVLPAVDGGKVVWAVLDL